MKLKNYTPFKGMAWESVDCNNQNFVTSLLRLKFKLLKNDTSNEWKMQLLPDQGELFGADVFYDEEVMGSVKYESDYVPFKVCADLIVNATAVAPNDKELSSWSCGVVLYDPNGVKLNSLRLEVKGPLTHGLRESVKNVPIRYELAKGGTLSAKKDDEGKLIATKLDLYNHAGCGKYPNHEKSKLCCEQNFYAGHSLKIPPGFGVIHRSWKSRLDLAGTYDKKWVKNQHPLPPHDFNYLHNQAAHPLLMVKEYIQAGSKIELENLSQESSNISFTIPEFKLLSRVKTQTDSTMEVLMLDTLIVDLDEEDDYIVYASYRAYTLFMDRLKEVELILIEDKV